MSVEFLELTFHGRGAIGVVGVRGNDAESYLNQCFAPKKKKPFKALKSQSIVYGTWNSTSEDLVVVRIADGLFEVQCHGSIAAIESVQHDLINLGAVECPNPEQWSSATSEFQQQVAVALESSLTQRTATVLLQQYQLWGKSDPLADSLAARQALTFEQFGRRLTSVWSVVLCGEPNVGKSSLINALSGYERAIVHPTAGTTRDLVTQKTAIDGWPVELVDSAGIRESENEIERAGVKKALERIDLADLVIQVVDATGDSPPDLSISRDRASIIAYNKVDLKNGFEPSPHPIPSVCLSAKTGQGLAELERKISELLVPELPGPEQLVPVTDSQVHYLRSIAGSSIDR